MSSQAFVEELLQSAGGQLAEHNGVVSQLCPEVEKTIADTKEVLSSLDNIIRHGIAKTHAGKMDCTPLIEGFDVGEWANFKLGSLQKHNLEKETLDSVDELFLKPAQENGGQ